MSGNTSMGGLTGSSSASTPGRPRSVIFRSDLDPILLPGLAGFGIGALFISFLFYQAVAPGISELEIECASAMPANFTTIGLPPGWVPGGPALVCHEGQCQPKMMNIASWSNYTAKKRLNGSIFNMTTTTTTTTNATALYNLPSN